MKYFYTSSHRNVCYVVFLCCTVEQRGMPCSVLYYILARQDIGCTKHGEGKAAIIFESVKYVLMFLK